MTSCEVAVIGAGIVGAAAARELSARGVDVCLLDAGPVAGGTTGLGEGNVLCSDKPPGPELELALAGLALYAELEERLGDEARIRRKGALVVHADEATWGAEPARVEALRAAGVEGWIVSVDELRALEPELTRDVCGAAWFPDDLQCDPRAIAQALSREASQAGARVFADRPVHGIVVRAGRVEALRTAAGTLWAGAVVLAAGPWSAALAATAGLRLPLEPRKGQLVRLDPGRRDARLLRHKVVDGSYLASMASDEAGLQISTVIETTWEGQVLVGSSRERRGFDLTVDEEVSRAMLERAGRLAPRLTGLRIEDEWAGLRPWLPDGLPAVGRCESVAGLWVATGHEGAGVALGPISGRVIAQAYSGEAPEVALAPFAPDRFG